MAVTLFMTMAVAMGFMAVLWLVLPMVVLMLMVEAAPQPKGQGRCAHSTSGQPDEDGKAVSAIAMGSDPRRQVHAKLHQCAEALGNGSNSSAPALVNEALRERREAHIKAIEAKAGGHNGGQKGHQVPGGMAEPSRSPPLAAYSQGEAGRSDEDCDCLRADVPPGGVAHAQASGGALKGGGTEDAGSGTEGSECREHDRVEACLPEVGREHDVVGGQHREEDQPIGEAQQRHSGGVSEEGEPGPRAGLGILTLLRRARRLRCSPNLAQLRTGPLRSLQQHELRHEGESIEESNQGEAL
mmetsp:Transcript_118464/g.264855  ORF Transcript_118464/g.264855 Transcript_118464/m.264855 type:complete len:298 (+) Transcript_118464:267-1160(+)